MGRPRKNVDIVEVIGRRWAGESFRAIAHHTGHGLGTIVRAHQQAMASLAAFQNAIAANLRTVTDEESRVGTARMIVSSSASDAEEMPQMKETILLCVA